MNEVSLGVSHPFGLKCRSHCTQHESTYDNANPTRGDVSPTNAGSPSGVGGVTDADRVEWINEAFSMIDTDNSNTIEPSELLKFGEYLGNNWTDQQVSEILAAVDANGDGTVTRGEFIEWCNTAQQQQDNDQFVEMIEGFLEAGKLKKKRANAIGGVYDELDQNGLGYITQLQLTTLAMHINASSTVAQSRELFSSMDGGGEGKVNRSQFTGWYARLVNPMTDEKFTQTLRKFVSFDAQTAADMKATAARKTMEYDVTIIVRLLDEYDVGGALTTAIKMYNEVNDAASMQSVQQLQQKHEAAMADADGSIRRGVVDELRQIVQPILNPTATDNGNNTNNGNADINRLPSPTPANNDTTNGDDTGVLPTRSPNPPQQEANRKPSVRINTSDAGPTTSPGATGTNENNNSNNKNNSSAINSASPRARPPVERRTSRKTPRTRQTRLPQAELTDEELFACVERVIIPLRANDLNTPTAFDLMFERTRDRPPVDGGAAMPNGNVPVIVTVGDVEGCSLRDKAALNDLYVKGVMSAARRCGGVIVDSGYEYGIPGNSTAAQHGNKTCVIGVSPNQNSGYAYRLSRHHSYHVTVTDALEAGDEVESRLDVAQAIAGNSRVVMIVATSQPKHLGEIESAINRGWCVVALQGSGGVADQLVEAWKSKANSLPDDPRIHCIVQGRFGVFPRQGITQELASFLCVHLMLDVFEIRGFDVNTSVKLDVQSPSDTQQLVHTNKDLATKTPRPNAARAINFNES